MMKINRQPFVMENLLSIKAVAKEETWFNGIIELKSYMLDEGLYQTGPVFFSVEEVEGEPTLKSFEYYLPISWEIGLEEAEISFVSSLELKDALVLRQADSAGEFTEAIEKIKKYAELEKIELEKKAYCVCTEVYEEFIIDIFMEIKGE
ncbi:hypothetical protein [uncultured Vagococcus sp.]|uniref:hypothetical protein n=1 Tax=uncultured Vagococcus sp. TaxID=189676 RepID=UPI0028D51B92|nr:hypothetical protein [uncultured Vagococcus sp.]